MTVATTGAPAVLDERRARVGASRVAAAVGLDPYCSPVQEWVYVTGRDERPTTEAMYWGTMLEPVIREHLSGLGVTVQPAGEELLRDNVRPWLVGRPDGYAALNGVRGVVELKTTSAHNAREWDDGGYPTPAAVQCLAYMALAGLDRALLACLIGGQRFVMRELAWHGLAWQAILGRLDAFYEHVRRDTPPPPMGVRSDDAAIATLWPEAREGQVMIADKPLVANVREYTARRRQRKATETQEKRLAQEIQLAMRDAERLVSPSGEVLAKWPQFVTHRLDGTALKKTLPHVHELYYHPVKSRRFTAE